jgi:hypothetical protein
LTRINLEKIVKRIKIGLGINLENLKISLANGKKIQKCRAFNKAIGPGKNSKINKHRAYVYSRL